MQITLEWHKSCEFEDLYDFFDEHREIGGLYLWVFKGDPDRIRYVGEADIFKNRFFGYKSHLQNITHGLYTAVNCSKEEDLVDKYKEIVEKKKDADQTGTAKLCYHPKPIKFEKKYADKTYLKETYIEDIKKGIDLSLEGFFNCRFLFAEILRDGKPADKHLRKEVESIFMKMLKKAYEKEKDAESLHWCNFKGTEFWGTISKHNKPSDYYEFTNQGEALDKVLKDIGITEKEGRKWSFPEEA